MGHYRPKHDQIESNTRSAVFHPKDGKEKQKARQIKEREFEKVPICAKLVKAHDKERIL